MCDYFTILQHFVDFIFLLIFLKCYPGGLCRCVDKENGMPISLGFGIASNILEAEEQKMNCRCANSYHESLKQGCRMQLDFGIYNSDLDYQVSQR